MSGKTKEQESKERMEAAKQADASYRPTLDEGTSVSLEIDPDQNKLNAHETDDMRQQRLFDEQSTGEALLIGAENFGINAVSSFIGNTAGVVAGVHNAMTSGDATMNPLSEENIDEFINNPINKYLAEFSENFNKDNPVYSDPGNSTLFDDVASAKFFSDVIGSAGYTAGGMASALTVGKLGSAARQGLLKSAVTGSTKEFDEFLKSGIADPLIRENVKKAVINNTFKGATSLTGAAMGRAYESSIEASQAGKEASARMAESLKDRKDLSTEEKSRMTEQAKNSAQVTSFSLNMMLGYSDMTQSAKMFNTFGDGVENVSKWWKEGLNQFIQEGGEEYAQNRIQKIAVDNEFTSGTSNKILKSFSTLVEGVGDREAQLAALSGGLSGAPMGIYAGAKNYDKQQKIELENKELYAKLSSQLKPNEKIQLDKNLKYAELEEQKNNGRVVLSALNNLGQVSEEQSSVKIPNSEHTLGSLKELSIEDTVKYAYESEKLKKELEISIRSASNAQLSETVFAAIDSGNLENLKLELEAISKSSNEEISKVIGEEVTNDNKDKKLKAMSAKIDKAEKIYNSIKNNIAGASPQQQREAGMIATNLEFLSTMRMKELHSNPSSLDLSTIGIDTTLAEFQDKFNEDFLAIKDRNTFSRKDIEDSEEGSPLAAFKKRVENNPNKETFRDNVKIALEQDELSKKSFMANVIKAVDKHFGPGKQKEKAEEVATYTANLYIHDKLTKEINNQRVEYQKSMNALVWNKQKAAQEKKDAAQVKSIKKDIAKQPKTVDEILEDYSLSEAPSEVKTPRLAAAFETFFNLNKDRTNSFGVNFETKGILSAVIDDIAKAYKESAGDNSMTGSILLQKVIEKANLVDGNNYWKTQISPESTVAAEAMLSTLGDRQQRLANPKPSDGIGVTPMDLYIYAEQNKNNRNSVLGAVEKAENATYVEVKNARERLVRLRNKISKKVIISEKGLVWKDGQYVPAVISGSYPISPSQLITQDVKDRYVQEINEALRGLKNIESPEVIDEQAIKAVQFVIETFDAHPGTVDNPKPDQDEIKLAIAEYENMLLTGKKSAGAGDFFFEKIDGQKKEVSKISLPVYRDGNTGVSKDLYFDKADPMVALVYVKDDKKHTLSFNRTKYYTSPDKGQSITSPEMDSLLVLFKDTNAIALADAMDLSVARNFKYNYANESLGNQTKTLAELPGKFFVGGVPTVTAGTIVQNDGNVIFVNPIAPLIGSNGKTYNIPVQSTQLDISTVKELSKLVAGVTGHSQINRLRAIVESIYVKGLTTENMNGDILEQLKNAAFVGQMVSQFVNKNSKGFRYDVAILSAVNEMAAENPDFFVSQESGNKLIKQLENDVTQATDQIQEQLNKTFFNPFIKKEYINEMIKEAYGKVKTQIDEIFPNLEGVHLGINVAQEKDSDNATAKLVVIPYSLDKNRTFLEGEGEQETSNIQYYSSTIDGQKWIQAEYFLDATVGDPTSKKVTGLEAEGGDVVSGDTILSYLNKNGMLRNAVFLNVEASQNPSRDMIANAVSKVMSPVDINSPIAGKLRGKIKVKSDFNQPVDSAIATGEVDKEKSPEQSAAEEDLEDLLSSMMKVDTGSNKLRDKKNLSKARRWVSRNLPAGITMKDFDGFTQRAYSQKGVLGQYIDNMILLSNEAGGSVVYHEAFHAVLNALIPQAERSHFLAIAEDEIGPIKQVDLSEFRSQHESRKNLSFERLKDLYLEEYMADQFAEYKMTNDAKPWWKQLWDGIIEWLGFAKVSGSQIKNLFYKIDTGQFAKSSIISSNSNALLFKVINKDDGSQIPVSESDDIIKGFASYFQYTKGLTSKTASSFFKPENRDAIRESLVEFLDAHEEVFESAKQKRNSLPDTAAFDINVFNDLTSRASTIENIDTSSVNGIIDLMIKEKSSIFDITSVDINPIDEINEAEKATLNDFDASAGEFSITPETIAVKRLFSNMPIEDSVMKSGLNSLDISDNAKKLINNNILFARFNNGDAMYAQAMSTLSDSSTFEEYLSKLDAMVSYPEWTSIKDKIRKVNGEPTNFAHLLRKATNYYYVDSSFVKEGAKTSVSTTGLGSRALTSATIDIQQKINGGLSVQKLIDSVGNIGKILPLMRSGSPKASESFNNNRKTLSNNIRNIGITIDPGLISFLAASYTNNEVLDEKNNIIDALERYITSITSKYAEDPESITGKKVVSQITILPGIKKPFEDLVKITARYNTAAPLVSIDRFAGKSIWNYVRNNHIVSRAKAINNANDISDLTDTKATIAYAPYLRDVDLLKQGNKNEDVTGSIDKDRVSLHVFRGSEKEDGNDLAFKEMSPADILEAQINMFFHAGGTKRFFMPYVIERKNTQYVYGVESPYITLDDFGTASSTLFEDTSSEDSDFDYKVSNTTIDIYYQMFMANIDQAIENKDNKEEFYTYRNELQNIIKYLEPFKEDFIKDKDKAHKMYESNIRGVINTNLRKAFSDFFVMLQDEGIVRINNQTKPSAGENNPIPRYLPTEVTSLNEMTSFDKKGNHKEAIKDYLSFFLESMIANQSLDHITMGDDRQWNEYNTKRSAEDNSAAAKINKSKRMAGAAASYSGMDMYGQYKYSFGKKIKMSESEQMSFTALKISDTFSYVKGAETFKDVSGNMEFTGPNPEDKKAVAAFKAFQDKMSAEGYSEVAITDGQAYQDINRLRNWMISDNKIRNEKDEKLIDKIAMDNEELSKPDWEYILKNTNVHLNSIKDIYYDGDTYLKESTTLLLRQITSVKETAGIIKDSLEAMYAKSGNLQREFNFNGRDYVKDSANGHWYYSAPKEFMGAILDTRKLHERLNQMQRMGATHMFHESCEKHKMSKPGGVFVLSNDKHGKQQETPSGHDHVVDGTQLQSLIMAAISDTDMIDGKSAKHTKAEILAAQVAIREISFDKVFSDILLKSKNKEDKLNIRKLYAKIKQANLSTGKDVIAQLFDKVGDEYVPKSMNIVSRSLRDSIISIINNKVLKQSVFGDKFYCVSAYGFEVIDEKTNKPRPLKIHTGEKPYSEVIVPVKDADFYGLKIGDEIPEDIMRALGVRIPTESAHSVIPMRVVALLPPYMGSQIIVPSEFVLYSGMDFDIDALYVNMTDYDKEYTPEGILFNKVQYDRGHSGINDASLFIDYAIEMLENAGIKNAKEYYNSEVLKTGSFSLMNNPTAKRTIMQVTGLGDERKYPATFAEWKAMKNKVISSRGLKNKQLDLRLSSFNSITKDGTNPQMEAAIKPADVDGLTSIGKQIARFMGTRLLSGLNNTVTDTYQQQKAQRTGKPLIDVAIAQVTGLSIALSYSNSLTPSQVANIEYAPGKRIPTNGKTIYDLKMDADSNGNIVFYGNELGETRLNAGSAAAAAILDDSKNATSFSMNYTKRTLSASFGGYLLGIGRMITGLMNNNPIIFSLDSLDDSEFKTYEADLDFIAFAADTQLGKLLVKGENGVENLYKLYRSYMPMEQKAMIADQIKEAKDKFLSKPLSAEAVYAYIGNNNGRNNLSSYGSPLDVPTYTLSPEEFNERYNKQKAGLLVNNVDSNFAKNQLHILDNFKKLEKLGGNLTSIQQAYTVPLKGFDQNKIINFDRMIAKIPNEFGAKEYLTKDTSLISAVKTFSSDLFDMMSKTILRSSALFEHIGDSLFTYLPGIDEIAAKERVSDIVAEYFVSEGAKNLGLFDVDFVSSLGSEVKNRNHRNRVASNVSELSDHAIKRLSVDQYLANMLNKEVEVASMLFGYTGFSIDGAIATIKAQYNPVIGNKFLGKLKANKTGELFTIDSSRLLSTDKFEVSNDFVNLPDKLKALVFSQAYYEGFSFGPTKVSSFMPAQELASPDVVKLFKDIDDAVLNINDPENFSGKLKNFNEELNIDDFAHMVFKRSRWLFKEVKPEAIDKFNLSDDPKKKFSYKYVYAKLNDEAVLYKLTDGDPAKVNPVVPNYEKSLSKIHKAKIEKQSSDIVKTDSFASIAGSRDVDDIAYLANDNIIVVLGVGDGVKQEAFFISKPKVGAKGSSAIVFSHNTELYSSDVVTNADRGIFDINSISNVSDEFIVINNVFNNNMEIGAGEFVTGVSKDFTARASNRKAASSAALRRASFNTISAVDMKLMKMLNNGTLISGYSKLGVIMSDISELRPKFFHSLDENISKINDYLSMIKSKIEVIVNEGSGISEDILNDIITDARESVFDEERNIEYYSSRMLEGVNSARSERGQDLLTQDQLDEYIESEYGEVGFTDMMKHKDVLLDNPSSKEYKDLTSQIGC